MAASVLMSNKSITEPEQNRIQTSRGFEILGTCNRRKIQETFPAGTSQAASTALKRFLIGSILVALIPGKENLTRGDLSGANLSSTTMSIYSRYAIAEESKLKDAAAKLEIFHQADQQN